MPRSWKIGRACPRVPLIRPGLRLSGTGTNGLRAPDVWPGGLRAPDVRSGGLQLPEGTGSARRAPGPPVPRVVSAGGLLGGVQRRPAASMVGQPARSCRRILVEHGRQGVPPLADPVPEARSRGSFPQVNPGEQDRGADRCDQCVEQLASAVRGAQRRRGGAQRQRQGSRRRGAARFPAERREGELRPRGQRRDAQAADGGEITRCPRPQVLQQQRLPGMPQPACSSRPGGRSSRPRSVRRTASAAGRGDRHLAAGAGRSPARTRPRDPAPRRRACRRRLGEWRHAAARRGRTRWCARPRSARAGRDCR